MAVALFSGEGVTFGPSIPVRASTTERTDFCDEVFASDIEGIAVVEGYGQPIGCFGELRVGAHRDFTVEASAEGMAVAVFVANQDGGAVWATFPRPPWQGLGPL